MCDKLPTGVLILAVPPPTLSTTSRISALSFIFLPIKNDTSIVPPRLAEITQRTRLHKSSFRFFTFRMSEEISILSQPVLRFAKTLKVSYISIILKYLSYAINDSFINTVYDSSCLFGEISNLTRKLMPV